MFANSMLNIAIRILIFIYTSGFVLFREAELCLLYGYYPRRCLSVLNGHIAIHFSSLSLASKRVLHLIMLGILCHLVDYTLPKPVPARNSNHASKTIVITGANSGVGYETARQLAVNYDMNVILGCRSKYKCDKAADEINKQVKGVNKAVPRIVDLADFDSVASFVSQLQDVQVDVLFNNAGYSTEPHSPVNKYGLDPSFTTMHLSHFLLTEELMKRNPSMRVVNTASIAHHACASVIPFVTLPKIITKNIPGCIDHEYLTNGIRTETDAVSYSRAKMANVMHAVEIPRHHPQSTSIAIDLGFVGTNIVRFMVGTFSFTNLGWMRSATVGVLPIMHAILSSDDELMNDLYAGRQWTDGGIVIDVFGRTKEAFSQSWWKESNNVDRSRMLELSRELWDVSMHLLRIDAFGEDDK